MVKCSKAASELIVRLPLVDYIIADKGYDREEIRLLISSMTILDIPSPAKGMIKAPSAGEGADRSKFEKAVLDSKLNLV